MIWYQYRIPRVTMIKRVSSIVFYKFIDNNIIMRLVIILMSCLNLYSLVSLFVKIFRLMPYPLYRSHHQGGGQEFNTWLLSANRKRLRTDKLSLVSFPLGAIHKGRPQWGGRDGFGKSGRGWEGGGSQITTSAEGIVLDVK